MTAESQLETSFERARLFSRAVHLNETSRLQLPRAFAEPNSRSRRWKTFRNWWTIHWPGTESSRLLTTFDCNGANGSAANPVSAYCLLPRNRESSLWERR